MGVDKMNIITLTGNLGKDNEMKHLQNGTAVLNNSVGVRSNSKVNGEYITSWFNVSVFGKGAEIFNQYTHKGSKVFLSGEVRVRTYQKNDGTTGVSVDLHVNNFEFLDSPNSNQNNQGANANYYQNNENNGGFNGGQQQSGVNTNDPFQNSVQGGFNMNNNTLEVDSSDLPF